MKMLKTLTSSAYHDLIDYNVVDQAGDHVGSLHSLWSDQNTGQLEFLGVKTGWLFGSNHVVPSEKAQIDEENRFIQIPYAATFIKEAPSIAADAEITEEQEAEIYRYYGVAGAEMTSTGTTTETSTQTAGAMGAAGTAGMMVTGAAATRETDVSQTTRAAAVQPEGTVEVALSEEQLKVGKRTVETGAVRLRKVIRTEVVNTPVELRREDVVVERIAATDMRPGDIAAADFKPQDLNITLHREEAVVAKETVVTGAVRLNKTSETETQTVSDTVRKEDVEVNRGVAGTTAQTTGTTGTTGLTGGTTTTGRTDFTESGTVGGTMGTGGMRTGDSNPDPLTGEPGSHPVGTGIGAASGAATGAAMGLAGGPVGAVIGGIAGAVTGGLIGKGVEEFFDPTEEASYWKSNYSSASYHDRSFGYEDYEPAYRTGYTGFGKYYGTGKRFEDVENDIRTDYESTKGASRLGYDKARAAIRDAYERLSTRAASGQRRS